MRILVYPNRLTVGGLQIIAIELAAAVRDRGHEVVVFCGSGPLVQLIRERRLRFVPGDVPRRPRPSPRVMRALRRLVERERIDLVHAHGTAAALEAFYGAHLLAGVPTVASHMTSTAIPRHLPTTIPLVVGTREIQEAAQPTRAGRVELLEPPVNTEEDHPSVDGSAFRRAHGLDDGRLNVVVVSRLSPHLKQEGLERAIDAVASLAEEEPARLVIVGDGESRRALAERADRVNRRLGWTAVVMIGELLDPRPAYAAADVVLGMGGSILRGMAFGKPAIVLGQGGFSEVLEPATIDRFLIQGFYGLGNGNGSAFRDQLGWLLRDASRRRELSGFSRRIVCERFSLGAAAERLEALYGHVITGRVDKRTTIKDGIDTAARLARHKLTKLPGLVPS